MPDDSVQSLTARFASGRQAVLSATPDAAKGERPLPGDLAAAVYVAAGPSELVVTPDQDPAAEIRRAKEGQAVRFLRGQTYRAGAFLGAPADGITLTGDGDLSLPAPVVRFAAGSGISIFRRQNVTLERLALVRDTPGGKDAKGVSIVYSRGVTVRKVYVTGFCDGFCSEGSEGEGNRCADVTFQGCIAERNYSPSQDRHSQGLFASYTDGLRILDCVLDTNGWLPGGPPGSGATIYNHNAYLTATCGPPEVRRSVFVNASSHGLQARSGGTVDGNWFVNCPIGMSYGLVNGPGPIVPGGVSGSVTNNVFVGSRDIAGQPRGYALELANIKQALVTSNVMVHGGPEAAVILSWCDLKPGRTDDGRPADLNGVAEVGIQSLTLAGNRVYDWSGGPARTAGMARLGSVALQSEWGGSGPDLRAIAADVAARRISAADGIARVRQLLAGAA